MMLSIKDNPISPVVQPIDYINTIITKLNSEDLNLTVEEAKKIKEVLSQYPMWLDSFKNQINQILQKLKV
jgi:hypothetical protein